MSEGTRQAGVVGFVQELRRRSPALFLAAAFHLVLLLVLTLLLVFDTQMILGIPRWIKPIKFALSIGLYLATMAWLLGDLKTTAREKRILEWVIILTLTIETVLITGQAARGTTSHFNISRWQDAMVFQIMGMAITVNTAIAGYVGLRFWRSSPPVPPAYLWGIRLGLPLFVLASLEGFVMATRLAHAVGVPDGGAGLPFVNWSTQGGDLRIAHFVGMHALQVLPLAGWLLSGLARTGRVARPVLWLWLLALAYAALSLALFLQAISGKPLLAG